jgi:glycosyltransferase involved in cell wall biosynthesis
MGSGWTATATADRTLPSFSIILETENLAQADFQGLLRSLACLDAQTPSPSTANEVLLIDSGDSPKDLLGQLCQQYAWLQVERAPEGTGYYDAKMLGARRATGEVVVFYDSDCLYEAQWLYQILRCFQAPGLQVVAGETRTRGLGLYGTAMAISYIFPQYSGETELQPASQYFLNNVAFRRDLLMSYPIPCDLPLYRGNCVVHALQLREAGQTIWRQPLARATHAPPNGLGHFFWRFLLIGHDYYWQQQLRRDRPQRQPLGNSLGNNQERAEPTGGWMAKLRIFQDRMTKLVAADWRHAVFFPLSLPVIIVSALLIAVGYWVTALRPRYLLEACDRLAIEM